jgi:hypothetical protein
MLVELQVIVFSELFGNKHKLCNNVPSVTVIITEKRSAVHTFKFNIAWVRLINTARINTIQSTDNRVCVKYL